MLLENASSHGVRAVSDFSWGQISRLQPELAFAKQERQLQFVKVLEIWLAGLKRILLQTWHCGVVFNPESRVSIVNSHHFVASYPELYVTN